MRRRRIPDEPPFSTTWIIVAIGVVLLLLVCLFLFALPLEGK